MEISGVSEDEVNAFSIAEAEARPHLASPNSGDSQRAAVELLKHPFSSHRDVQQRRSNRAPDMWPPLAPIHTRKCETAPQRANRRNINAKIFERLRSTSRQFIGVICARPT